MRRIDETTKDTCKKNKGKHKKGKAKKGGARGKLGALTAPFGKLFGRGPAKEATNP